MGLPFPTKNFRALIGPPSSPSPASRPGNSETYPKLRESQDVEEHRARGELRWRCGNSDRQAEYEDGNSGKYIRVSAEALNAGRREGFSISPLPSAPAPSNLDHERPTIMDMADVQRAHSLWVSDSHATRPRVQEDRTSGGNAVCVLPEPPTRIEKELRSMWELQALSNLHTKILKGRPSSIHKKRRATILRRRNVSRPLYDTFRKYIERARRPLL